MWVCFLVLYSVYINICLSLCQHHTVLLWIYIVSIEIRYQKSYKFVLLFWYCFSFSSFFAFSYTFYSQIIINQFSSVQSLSRVWLFATPWIAARQASLFITNSWSSLRLMSIESVMPSSHLILCRPLLLLPPIPPSISLFQWVNSSH